MILRALGSTLFPYTTLFRSLRVANARYWSRKEHTALDKQASALRQQRLIEIKLELADMSKRCARSEEHTSELQSHSDLVCRLLLEKKNSKSYANTTSR